jgi:hypothetical protein
MDAVGGSKDISSFRSCGQCGYKKKTKGSIYTSAVHVNRFPHMCVDVVQPIGAQLIFTGVYINSGP